MALLTILRTISNYRSEGKIDIDKFKIVYVAPMKALAAEIVRKFSKRLQYLKIQVRELTGDMQLTKSEISNTVTIRLISKLLSQHQKNGMLSLEKALGILNWSRK